MNRIRVWLAVAICIGTQSANALDMKTFAQSMGYMPLNPPQRVLAPDSNLWKPGTVVYLDRVKRKVFSIPACELLFLAPPASTSVQLATTGSVEEKASNAFGLALELLKGLLEPVIGTASAKFDASKHIKVAYTGLGALTSTDEDMIRAARSASVDGSIQTDCAKVLSSSKFNKGTASDIKFRFPVYVITSTGLARGMKIELTSAAKSELGADIKVTDVVNVKPSWTRSRTTTESVEIESMDLPVIWGYRAEPVANILQRGLVSGVQAYRVKFGEPVDDNWSVADLQDAEFGGVEE